MSKRYIAILDEQGKLIKFKRNTITCYCPAYPFPHRLGSGLCLETKPGYYSVDKDKPINAVVDCNQKDYDIPF